MASSACSFSQQHRSGENEKTHPPVERRIEQLICVPKYQYILDKIEKDSLITLGTVIEKNMATCQIGKPDKKNKQGTDIVYTVLYNIKVDKIVSITKGQR